MSHDDHGSGSPEHHDDFQSPEEAMERFLRDFENEFSQDTLNTSRKAFHDGYGQSSVDENLSRQFSYAKALLRSNKREHITEGIGLMAELCRSSEYMTEALFFRSLGYYRLGEYRKCKDMIVELLRVDPLHKRGSQMLDFYQVKMQQRGLYGLLIVGSIVVLGLGFIWWSRRSPEPTPSHRTSGSRKNYSPSRHGLNRLFHHKR
eukprot:gb/GECG01013824.1/.p1 GENE.gb/GECG01013824.1/~~gb/GECG01013824.1/.p1  ORF type:complete len:204 (+),score=19.42 gb/GECG01013824.1/:1-612(+)